MLVSVLLMTSLLLVTQAAQVSFRINPRRAVEAVDNDVKLECKVPQAALGDVSYGIMVMIRQTSSNGSQESVTIIKTASMLSKHPDNRTEAEGKVPSPESEDKAISLTVTLLEPVEEDSGTYECQVLYVDTNNGLQNYIATARLNVSAVPPPNYIPELSNDCECDAIWDEIDEIKASLGTGGGSGPAPAASECQVSFSAHFQTRHGYLIYSGETAMFDSATSNKGDAYSVDTGEFTAPCDGQYYFSVTLRSNQELDAGYVDGVIMADDVAVARSSVFTESAISNLEQATASSVVTLAQGQKVKVVIQSTSAGEFIGEEYSTFTGFYISP